LTKSHNGQWLECDLRHGIQDNCCENKDIHRIANANGKTYSIRVTEQGKHTVLNSANGDQEIWEDEYKSTFHHDGSMVSNGDDRTPSCMLQTSNTRQQLIRQKQILGSVCCYKNVNDNCDLLAPSEALPSVSA